MREEESPAEPDCEEESFDPCEFASEEEPVDESELLELPELVELFELFASEFELPELLELEESDELPEFVEL